MDEAIEFKGIGKTGQFPRSRQCGDSRLRNDKTVFGRVALHDSLSPSNSFLRAGTSLPNPRSSLDPCHRDRTCTCPSRFARPCRLGRADTTVGGWFRRLESNVGVIEIVAVAVACCRAVEVPVKLEARNITPNVRMPVAMKKIARRIMRNYTSAHKKPHVIAESLQRNLGVAS